MKKCPYCAEEIQDQAIKCKHCGSSLAEIGVLSIPAQNFIVKPKTTSDKNKIVAGVLALFLGGIGIHKFYLGKTGQGVLYFLFCWTFIPVVIALFEGIIYLTMSDEKFSNTYP